MPRGCLVPLALLFGLACSSEPPIEGTGGSKAKDRADAGARTKPKPNTDAPTAPEPGSELDSTGSALCPPDPDRCAAFGDERPDRLSEHSAVYDPDHLQMVVFGGTHGVPVNCAPGTDEFSDELWLYDDPCGRFERIENTGPSARGRHMAAFGGGRMWIFGGRFREGASGPYQMYYDLWSFDPQTLEWTEMPAPAEQPTARVNGALVYDGKREALWLMGGNQSDHGDKYLPTNDVWSYSITDESWQQQSVSVGPAPRLFHSALLDPVRDTLVVFGGADETALTGINGYFSDLWALDLKSLTWEQLAPSLAGPSGRFSAQLVFDAQRGDYLLVGGHDDGVLGNRNDTWRFDPESGAWTELGSEDTFNSPGTGVCLFPPDFAKVDVALPERRHSHTLVWSEACQHALLFAGKTDCGSADDVWRFAGDTWTERLGAREGEVCLRWREDESECGDICF